MGYLLVENFGEGLDSRRSLLTTKAGALLECKNAHITRGKEIEKRKKFSPFAELPNGTFGMQSAANSLYTFGSIGSPTGIPATVTYQRLSHPNGNISINAGVSRFYKVGTQNYYTIDKLATSLFYSRTPHTLVNGDQIKFDNLPSPTSGIDATTTYIVSNKQANGSFNVTTTAGASISVSDTIAMSELVFSETFNGKIYAIAKYENGSIHHFFDGTRITTWDTVAAAVASNVAVASSLATQIDGESLFTATPVSNTFTITGPSEKAFNVTLSAINGGATNNQTLTQSTSQNAVVGIPASGPVLSVDLAAADLASSINADVHFSATVSGTTITITGPVNDPFTITAATTQGGTQTQSINVVTTQVHSGSQPQISEAQLVGAFEPNDVYQITLTIPSISHVQTFSVTCDTPAVAALPQITTITVGGTFEANDRFSVNLSIPSLSYSKQFSISASSSGVGTTVRTFGDKVYSTTKSLLYFSQIGDATQWGGTTNGAGFINITTQEGGGENLTALGAYQNRLAVFSRNSTQIWQMDADPNNNIKAQVLPNVGTFAPRSVTAFGDLDVFFLSDSGIRSLRARDASNAATVSDIGTAIDTLIQEYMRSLDETVRNSAIGIIEPSDGRYWLSVGDKIFVFSYFPSSKVAAWSTYEPGFSVSSMAYANGRIYIRSGNVIYLYGGASGNEYDDCEVSVVIPFLDGGKPAHTKTIQALDMACENSWSVEVGTDISQPNVRINAGAIQNSSYMIGRIMHFGIGTHVSAKMTCNSGGYARIGNMAIHYTIADAE